VIKEAAPFSVTSVLTRATRRNIVEDGVLRCCRDLPGLQLLDQRRAVVWRP
jgi:hypothetical protein